MQEQNRQYPRVRINLRLVHTGRAENVLRVNKYDTAGNLVSSPPAAYAVYAILKNVVPVVQEEKRVRIASGASRKMPCAWLEGDLVAWNGRFQKAASTELRSVLRDLRRDDLMIYAGSYRREFSRTVMVGFNPKKLKGFYTNEGRNIFEGAKMLYVCHWGYMAQGASLKPVTSADIVHNAVPASSTELKDVPKGVERTRERLEYLRLSLQ